MKLRLVDLNSFFWPQVSALRQRATVASAFPIGQGTQGANDLDSYKALGAVFCQSGELVAYLVYRKNVDSWEILDLAVAPESQRQGCMSFVLRSALSKLPAGHEAWLEVHENNQPARAFYQHMGFREVGRRAHYYADRGAAILMNYSPDKTLR